MNPLIENEFRIKNAGEGAHSGRVLANSLAALRAWGNVGADLSKGELFQTRYADHAKVLVLYFVGGGYAV